MPERHWHCEAVSRELLPQPSLPTWLLNPYQTVVHHSDLLFLNFCNSTSATSLSPRSWAGPELIGVRVVGAWGTVHLGVRWGRSDGVGLCWECSLLETLHWGKGPDTQPPVSIHHLSLCEPTSQISQAGKQGDLMNSCTSHVKFAGTWILGRKK